MPHSGHYQDLGITRRKGHDSACKLILSVDCFHLLNPRRSGALGAANPTGSYVLSEGTKYDKDRQEARYIGITPEGSKSTQDDACQVPAAPAKIHP